MHKPKKTGILEATEVIEPNIKDLNNSSSYSNLLHCDIEGPLLFQQETMKQLQIYRNPITHDSIKRRDILKKKQKPE